MKVIFKYSQKIEQEMIDYFEDQKKQGNEFSFVKLPKGEEAKIKEKDLAEKKNQIKTKWKKIEKGFFDLIKDKNPEIDKKYICYLARCGSCGFYIPPKSLVIRISNKKDLEESNLNIGHELVHLILKKNEKDKNLEYEEKEKLVDKILIEKPFREILPDYQKQDFS
jgi:Zn-dependent peptidase ImmA (M78 family)